MKTITALFVGLLLCMFIVIFLFDVKEGRLNSRILDFEKSISVLSYRIEEFEKSKNVLNYQIAQCEKNNIQLTVE